jgi:Mor family transcriptional regulator
MMSQKISSNNINNFIEKKINILNNDNNKDIDINKDNEDTDEIEYLEKEFITKSYNIINQPKNYGNLWTDEERKKIIKNMKKNNYINNINLYDESNILKIAKKIERSESGVKEEIKRMIFNDYITGYEYKKLSEKYNIPENNIKLMIRIYLEKNGKKILYPIEIENKILKYQIENIKLKKELNEINKLNIN